MHLLLLVVWFVGHADRGGSGTNGELPGKSLCHTPDRSGGDWVLARLGRIKKIAPTMDIFVIKLSLIRVSLEHFER